MKDEKVPVGAMLWVNVGGADAPKWRVFGRTTDDEENEEPEKA